MAANRAPATYGVTCPRVTVSPRRYSSRKYSLRERMITSKRRPMEIRALVSSDGRGTSPRVERITLSVIQRRCAGSCKRGRGGSFMAERMVRANGIELWCEDFGDPGNPAVLLVMGAGGQGIMWPEEFCAALADAGFYVIRYDNRDTGHSTCVDFSKAPYTLSDMARDAIGLLDAFGIARAHVIGASMGGMIAQTLAIEHAGRLRTLTSIMSTPSAAGHIRARLSGGPSRLPGSAKKVMDLLQARAANPPRTVEERIEQAV